LAAIAAVLCFCAAAAPTNATSQDARAEPPQDARAFLQGLSERALEELVQNEIDAAERERRFRTLFNESFDLEAIGRFVLGAHWRSASEAQRLAFLDVFEDSVVQRFLPLFAEYSGESLEISGERRDANSPKHVFVATTVRRSEGEPLKVEWRIRQEDSNYRILDVIAEGVSMAITLRQEYSSVIKQFGIDGLVEQLRAKVDAGAFKPLELNKL